jgi:hypothetical protein
MRLEVGEKELQNGELTYKGRFDGEKGTIKLDKLASISEKLNLIQSKMLNEQRKKVMSNIKTTDNKDEFVAGLKERNTYLKHHGAEAKNAKIR